MDEHQMKDAALRLALDALVKTDTEPGSKAWERETEAITAINQALAQEKALQALHNENERLGLYKDAYKQPDVDQRSTESKETFDQSEPVAWRYNGNLHEFDPSDWATGPVTPLYTSPPKREPLTDDEIDALPFPPSGTATLRDFVRIIEAAHGIKE